MLSFYVRLRLKQFLRFFSFNDLHPLLGLPLLAVVFTVMSLLLFSKTHYAGWIYVAAAYAILMELQNRKMNAYLRQVLQPGSFFKLKLIENVIVLTPFATIMLLKGAYTPLLTAIVLVAPYSYFSFTTPKPNIKSIPSFYKPFAFEFNFVWRAFAIIFIACIALLVIAAVANNVYLFIVPYIIMLFFLQAGLGMPEDKFYVWVYHANATAFLLSKLKTVAYSMFITAVPFLLLGGIFFFSEIWLILLIFVFANVAVVGCMFIKYHFYPNAFITQISQILFFGFTLACIVSPPGIIVILLFLIFSFYKARKNLKSLLHA